MDESRVVINLASKEYSGCVEKHLQSGDRFITCVFGVWENDRVVQKGVYAKMARGEMVRFMADIHFILLNTLHISLKALQTHELGV